MFLHDFHVINACVRLCIASELNEFCGLCTKQRLPDDMNVRKYLQHSHLIIVLIQNSLILHVEHYFMSLFPFFYSQFHHPFYWCSPNIRTCKENSFFFILFFFHSKWFLVSLMFYLKLCQWKRDITYSMVFFY